MKYIKYTFLTILLITSFFCISDVSAITINDYINELNKLEAKKAGQLAEQEKTEQEIQAAKKEMEQISNKIVQASEDISKFESEISELEKKIDIKEKQIKDLVSFLQISDSENFYLKYIFGAENFTDLIYRISVIEQLTTKSDELIDEMNSLIAENQKKIDELEQKKVELNEMNIQVLQKINELGKEKEKYFDETLTIDEEIRTVKNQIKLYRDLGCKDDENISTCTSMIPSSSGFIRPVRNGVITDNYGVRVAPCYGCSTFHKGIDIGGNREGTTVMAAAAGRVVDVDKYTCGGKVVTINHNINGKEFSTRYFHLLKTNVKVGDIVAQGEKIAEVGGGNTAYYDSCSTGPHLHFEVIISHYNYSTYYSNIRDPRNYVDFPRLGVFW
ncbi:MAG: peptidoglycan DD-metalloendopeptidase family protein [bacterium]|nr:peptidoglycan DD-metalloendopeptidase family protein [bacterium]